jgi:hypothetical protein
MFRTSMRTIFASFVSWLIIHISKRIDMLHYIFKLCPCSYFIFKLIITLKHVKLIEWLIHFTILLGSYIAASPESGLGLRLWLKHNFWPPGVHNLNYKEARVSQGCRGQWWLRPKCHTIWHFSNVWSICSIPVLSGLMRLVGNCFSLQCERNFVKYL